VTTQSSSSSMWSSLSGRNSRRGSLTVLSMNECKEDTPHNASRPVIHDILYHTNYQHSNIDSSDTADMTTTPGWHTCYNTPVDNVTCDRPGVFHLQTRVTNVKKCYLNVVFPARNTSSVCMCDSWLLITEKRLLSSNFFLNKSSAEIQKYTCIFSI